MALDPVGTPEWPAFHTRVVFVYEARIAFVADWKLPIVWLYTHEPGIVTPRQALRISILLGRMGFEEIRSTSNARGYKYLERLGFEPLDNETYRLKCRLMKSQWQSASVRPSSARHSQPASFTARSSTA